MKKVALSEVKDDLSRYLRLAESEEVIITRHGRAAGVLVGFHSEDAWFDYRLENDPRFLKRVESARASLRAGRGIRIEDLPTAAGTHACMPPRRQVRSTAGKRKTRRHRQAARRPAG